jgi:hypothetical protein
MTTEAVALINRNDPLAKGAVVVAGEEAIDRAVFRRLVHRFLTVPQDSVQKRAARARSP